MIGNVKPSTTPPSLHPWFQQGGVVVLCPSTKPMSPSVPPTTSSNACIASNPEPIETIRAICKGEKGQPFVFTEERSLSSTPLPTGSLFYIKGNKSDPNILRCAVPLEVMRQLRQSDEATLKTFVSGLVFSPPEAFWEPLVRSVKDTENRIKAIAALAPFTQDSSTPESKIFTEKWENHHHLLVQLQEDAKQLGRTIPDCMWEFLSGTHIENLRNQTLGNLQAYVRHQVQKTNPGRLLRHRDAEEAKKNAAKAAAAEELRKLVEDAEREVQKKRKQGQKTSNRRNEAIEKYQPRDREGPRFNAEGLRATAVTHPTTRTKLLSPTDEHREAMQQEGFTFVENRSPARRLPRYPILKEKFLHLAERVLRWDAGLYEDKKGLLDAIRLFPDGDKRYARMNEPQLLAQFRRHHFPGIEELLLQDWFQKDYALSLPEEGKYVIFVEHAYPNQHGHIPIEKVREFLSLSVSDGVLYHSFLHPQEDMLFWKGGPLPLCASLFDSVAAPAQETGSPRKAVHTEGPYRIVFQSLDHQDKPPNIEVSVPENFLAAPPATSFRSFTILPKPKIHYT